MQKITVNGVTYGSVNDMPPDVRRVYEETLAKFPDLADRDGDGIPDVVPHEGLSVRHGTTVRKKIVVNGTTYEDVSAMPPDVRQLYEKAMSAARAGGPNVKRNEIHMSVQLHGPGFSFGTGSGLPSTSQPMRPTVGSGPSPLVRALMTNPIEPSSLGAGGRIVRFLGACALGALFAWLLTRIL